MATQQSTEEGVNDPAPAPESAPQIDAAFVAELKKQMKQLQMSVQGLKSYVARQERSISSVQKDVYKKQEVETENDDTLKVLRSRINAQDKIIEELQTALKAVAPKEEKPKVKDTRLAELIDYTEKLVDDLQNADSPDVGSGILGFNPEADYPKNTVGWGIKRIWDMVNNMPNALNFGPPEEHWIMNKAITVKQGFAMAKVPASTEFLELDTIKGLKKNDILVLTARGEVRLVNLTGNLKLKKDCTLISGKFIVLHRSADSWEEIGRSH